MAGYRQSSDASTLHLIETDEGVDFMARVNIACSPETDLSALDALETARMVFQGGHAGDDVAAPRRELVSVRKTLVSAITRTGSLQRNLAAAAMRLVTAHDTVEDLQRRLEDARYERDVARNSEQEEVKAGTATIRELKHQLAAQSQTIRELTAERDKHKLVVDHIEVPPRNGQNRTLRARLIRTDG